MLFEQKGLHHVRRKLLHWVTKYGDHLIQLQYGHICKSLFATA
jgi:hypothetical protein